MCEIVILISMCRYLARTAKSKEQPGWPFVLLMIFSWFVGGIGGAIAGVAITGDDHGDLPLPAIIGYVIGVSIACIGNALIVNMLPDRSRDYDRDRYDDERRYSERRRQYGGGRYDDDRDDRDRDYRDDRDRDYRDDRDDRDRDYRDDDRDRRRY